jgi:transposase
MHYYAGLDVSLKETFVSIIDENGTIIHEQSVPSDVDALSTYLKKTNLPFDRIGIESGQLSIPLCKGLSQEGLPVICVDARHMAAALSARINKNDKNDARGIAQMLRVNLYKEVTIKSDEACEVKFLLGSRRHLMSTKYELMGTIRGLLKIYGIKLGAQAHFFEQARAAIKRLSPFIQRSVESILLNITELERSLDELTQALSDIGKEDESCKRLMTVPGVGVIVAMTYKAAVDCPERFEDSYVVGAYFGLTPKQYASGEVDRYGSISKMGSKECRTLLYEAAQSLLTRVGEHSKLKAWGLKLMQKKGRKKAIVAVARKLAVIMHRMLMDKTEFRYT